MKKNDRRCLSCRRLAPKEEFWRIVRTYPSRTVQLDEGMGRSAYICPCQSCLKTAQYKNRLGRSLKAKVPDEIYEQLWQRLTDQRSSAGKGSSSELGSDACEPRSVVSRRSTDDPLSLENLKSLVQ